MSLLENRANFARIRLFGLLTSNTILARTFRFA